MTSPGHVSSEKEEHATLAPSAADRWIQCPASVRMERVVDRPPGTSVYAEEGTAAHALAYLTASRDLTGRLSQAEFIVRRAAWQQDYHTVVSDEAEMVDHVEEYVNLLRERRAEGSVLLLEQRVPTGVPSCWGTSDAVMVSPEQVEIVDLKYGKGHRVEVTGNPQLRLYGVGALEAFGDLLGEPEVVRMTVFQPRLDHVVTEELTALELRAWRDSIIPIAEEALGHDAHFGPSEEACRWCPASGQCKAQLEWSTALDFGIEQETLTPEELADALDRIPAIEQWCAAVRQYALDKIYSQGGEVPGYKVVMSSGRRSIPDQERAIEALELVGFALDQVSTRKLNTIGDLEKLLKRSFNMVLGPFISRSTGTPALVKEEDERDSVTPEHNAVRDFTVIRGGMEP